MKSKLKIWGSNTISRGAYSSTGNLTSISCSLSLPVLCIQTTCGGFMVMGDDLYKRRKIKHYMRSQGANYFRVSGAFATQFEESVCLLSLHTNSKPFSVSIFLPENSLIFSAHSFSSSLDSVQVAPQFFIFCVFFCTHTRIRPKLRALQFDLIKMQI